jgi:hypothetical protein
MRILLILLVSVCLVSCGLYRNKIDSGLNPYLGKHKDEYVKAIGPPAQCSKLLTGGEACEWVRHGSEQQGVNCVRNYGTGGTDCSGRGGSTWEHRVVFAYDRNGIAEEWSYRGSWGSRSSKDSQSSK